MCAAPALLLNTVVASNAALLQPRSLQLCPGAPPPFQTSKPSRSAEGGHARALSGLRASGDLAAGRRKRQRAGAHGAPAPRAPQVQRCTLLSIKTGGCPETCTYCAQSSSWSKSVGLKAEKLMGVEEVLEARPARPPPCLLA